MSAYVVNRSPSSICPFPKPREIDEGVEVERIDRGGKEGRRERGRDGGNRQKYVEDKRV